jgi:hypothetical protein
MDILHYSSVTHDEVTHPQSTTMNARTLETCEAKENGIPCWRHADVPYLTSEDITRQLCKICFDKVFDDAIHIRYLRLLQMLRDRDSEEGGRVA